MKKGLSVIAVAALVLSLLIMGTVSVSASLEHKFHGVFTYTIIGGEATIVDVRADVVPQAAIPAMLENCPVTGIEESAFQSCANMVSVEIPVGVRLIGTGAFEGCTALQEIIVDEKNAYYTAKDGVLFSKDGTALVCYPGGKAASSYVVPDTVTSIEPSAFYGCAKLTSVTIPNTVTSIGKSAFFGCTTLGNVKIGNGVTGIGESAFAECAALEKVVIPNGVTSVGRSAFEKCSKLSEVTIGKGVKMISSQLFLDCTALTSVTIPNGVTEIEGGAFARCTGLQSVSMGGTVQTVGARAFYECTNLREVLFAGSESARKSIAVGAVNDPFTAAAWKYNVRLDDGQEFVWWWLIAAGAAVVLVGIVVILMVRGAKVRK